MTFNLELLPDDLLQYFLTSLHCSNDASASSSDLQRDFRTLSSLSLTSTKLYETSTPVLWSEIPLTLARLGWFLALLERRPDLRSHVRREISGMNGNVKGEVFSPSQVSNVMLAESSESEGSHLFSYSPLVIYYLYEGAASLSLDSSTSRGLSRILGSIWNISSRKMQGSYDYSEVIRALLLPNLVKLDVRFVVPDEISATFFDSAAGNVGVSKVTDLTLHGALDPVNYQMLSTLLAIPGYLERLSLSSSRNTFSAQALLEGLSDSSTTLRDFTLIESRPIGWGIKFEKDPEPLVRLDLPHLENLCISHNYFFGQGGDQKDLHIPDSVRVLDIIYSISEHSLSALKAFLQHGTLPKSLKTIRVDKAFFEASDEADWESDVSEDEHRSQSEIEILREICARRGLGLGRSKIDNDI